MIYFNLFYDQETPAARNYSFFQLGRDVASTFGGGQEIEFLMDE
jgi:hypothetical protein